MDMAITILMLVPVVLAVALIIGVIRKNITERKGGEPVDITGAIPAVIVLMVAVLIIGSMGAAATPYYFDEDSGQLTIQKSIPQSGTQPWDSYASDVRSLVIEEDVTIGSGAFDSLTSLEYVSIANDVTIKSNAFGVTLEDMYGQTMADNLSGRDFVKVGSSLVSTPLESEISATVSDGAATLNGFAAGVSDVVTLVVPEDYDGKPITKIRYSAFTSNATLTSLAFVPSSHVANIENDAFKSSALTFVDFPDSLRVIDYQSFLGCHGLTTALIKDGVQEIGSGAFSQCDALTSVHIPGTVTAIKAYAFMNNTGTTEVSFGTPFNATLTADWAAQWTFKAADGTTTLEKTAANLAGHTFRGTASALVLQS